MRREAKKREDAMGKGKGIKHWIRKAMDPMLAFNRQKEKGTYQQAKKEMLGPKWITSMSNAPLVYDMPSVYDRTILERSIKKVKNLKDFLKSCL
jgi:hypothetical protein